MKILQQNVGIWETIHQEVLIVTIMGIHYTYIIIYIYIVNMNPHAWTHGHPNVGKCTSALTVEMVGTGGKSGFKMLLGRQEIDWPHKQLKDSCSK